MARVGFGRPWSDLIPFCVVISRTRRLGNHSIFGTFAVAEFMAGE